MNAKNEPTLSSQSVPSNTVPQMNQQHVDGVEDGKIEVTNASNTTKSPSATINMKSATFHQPTSTNKKTPSSFTNSTFLGDSSSTWLGDSYHDNCEPTEEESETDLADFGESQTSLHETNHNKQQLLQQQLQRHSHHISSNRLLNFMELSSLLEEVNQQPNTSHTQRKYPREISQELSVEEMARILKHINTSEDADVDPRWDLICELAYEEYSSSTEGDEAMQENNNILPEAEQPNVENDQQEMSLTLDDIAGENSMDETYESEEPMPDNQMHVDEDEESLDPLDLFEDPNANERQKGVDDAFHLSLVAHHGSMRKMSLMKKQGQPGSQKVDKNEFSELGETGHEKGEENYQLLNQRLKLVHNHRHSASSKGTKGRNTLDKESLDDPMSGPSAMSRNEALKRGVFDEDKEEEISITLSQLEIRSNDSDSSSVATDSTFTLECQTESVASSVTWNDEKYDEVPLSFDEEDRRALMEDSSSSAPAQVLMATSNEHNEEKNNREQQYPRPVQASPRPMNPTIQELMEYRSSSSSSAAPQQPGPQAPTVGTPAPRLRRNTHNTSPDNNNSPNLNDVSPYGECDSLEYHRKNRRAIQHQRRSRGRKKPNPNASSE